MTNRLIGLETEYGLASLREGGAADPGADAERLVFEARRRYPHLLASNGGGIFLSNGARFYVDPGEGRHPEVSTPEVYDPADVVAYTAAGEEMLHELAATVAVGDKTRPLVFKCNTDYENQASWACHENVSHASDPMRLAPAIIPHLISRIVYSGGGGLDPFAAGIELCLSPRSFQLSHEISPHSTHSRGIYHLKEESLAVGRWRRLHLLCGESLCSHVASYLKVGTTALIVALTEAGLAPAENVRVSDPLGAMHAFARDLSLRATARLVDGEPITALEMQWRFLRFVEAHLEHERLPAWAPRCCAVWRELLGQLADEPQVAGRRCDWAVKAALYRHHLEHAGFGPEEVATLNRAVAPSRPRRLQRTRRLNPLTALLAQRLAAQEGELAGDSVDPLIDDVAAEPEGPKPDPERVREFLRVRTQLCELEIRFSQLGPHSLFARLERAGLVDHRLSEVTPERVRHAILEPPSDGRARWRGLAIKELHGSGDHHCTWTAVHRRTGEVLDLSDPYPTNPPTWTPPSPARPPRRTTATTPAPAALVPEQAEYDLFISRAHDEYARGDYEAAWQVLRTHDEIAPSPSLLLRRAHLELEHWLQARRGFHAEALASYHRWAETTDDTFDRILGLIVVYRHQGLVPGAETTRHIQAADDFLARVSGAEPRSAFAYREHKATWLLGAGQAAEARAVLEGSLRGPIDASGRIIARTQVTLAEACRRVGDLAAAHRWLDEAQQRQESNHILGDLAEYCLPCRAKLESDHEAAMRHLERAEQIQVTLKHLPGLARTLCLKARVGLQPLSARRHRRRLQAICAERPALACCPLVRKIDAAWSRWWGGHQPDSEADRFWGL